MWESRVAPLAGVLFGLFLLGSFALAPNTDFMPSADTTVAYLSDGPLTVVASGYVRLLAAAALTWFGGSLYRSIRTDEDQTDRLSALAASGAVLAAGLLALGAVATMAAAERVGVTGSIETSGATTLFDLSSIATGSGAPIGFALMTGATAIAWLRSGRSPAWATWSTLALAAALLSPYAWAVVAVVVIWVPFVSLAIYRNEREPAPLARAN